MYHTNCQPPASRSKLCRTPPFHKKTCQGLLDCRHSQLQKFLISGFLRLKMKVMSSSRREWLHSWRLQVTFENSQTIYLTCPRAVSTKMNTAIPQENMPGAAGLSTQQTPEVLHLRRCPSGLHTLDATASSCLRCEQDREFAASLQVDQRLNIQICPQRLPEEPSDVASVVNEEEICEDSPLPDVLRKLRLEVDSYAPANIVNVTRGREFEAASRAFSRSTFRPQRKLSVKFAGDQGVDNGGLSREFMRLLLHGLHTSMLFEGPPGRKQLSLNMDALRKGKYKVAGQILAYCLVHAGLAPAFLSEGFVSQLVPGRQGQQSPNIRDIVDDDVRQKVEALKNASSPEAFEAAADAAQDIISLAGCVVQQQFIMRDNLVHSLVYFILEERIRGPLTQFQEGLTMLGVHAALTNKSVQAAFLHNHNAEWTADRVEDLFNIVWSEVGSNSHNKELHTHTHWRDLLLDLQDDGKLADLISFTTGLDVEPAFGFEPKPTLKFQHPVPDMAEWEKMKYESPYANTCALELSLPIHEEYDKFKEVMYMALEIGAQVFTNA